jgi:hypothetical protein
MTGEPKMGLLDQETLERLEASDGMAVLVDDRGWVDLHVGLEPAKLYVASPSEAVGIAEDLRLAAAGARPRHPAGGRRQPRLGFRVGMNPADGLVDLFLFGCAVPGGGVDGAAVVSLRPREVGPVAQMLVAASEHAARFAAESPRERRARRRRDGVPGA